MLLIVLPLFFTMELSDKHRKVLRLLKKMSKFGGTTYDELQNTTGYNRNTLYVIIHELRKEGYPIRINNNRLFIEQATTKNSREVTFDGNHFRIGLIADTHIGSKQFNEEKLRDFYKIAEDWGADAVLHAGDILEGFNVYRGQENEIDVWGVDAQVDLAVEVYPDNVPTVFITGNHDLAVMKTAGVDVGKLIARERPDMEYIGRYSGDVYLSDFHIKLLHPDGGVTYALSYKPQKYVEGYLAAGEELGLLLFGHLHEQIIMHHAKTYVVLPGCFQNATDYLLRKGLTPVIGGVLADINVKSGRTDILFRVVKWE